MTTTRALFAFRKGASETKSDEMKETLSTAVTSATVRRPCLARKAKKKKLENCGHRFFSLLTHSYVCCMWWAILPAMVVFLQPHHKCTHTYIYNYQQFQASAQCAHDRTEDAEGEPEKEKESGKKKITRKMYALGSMAYLRCERTVNSEHTWWQIPCVYTPYK